MYSFLEAATAFDSYYQNNLIFPELPHNLYEPCRYTLEGLGKKIRPVLCLMSYQLYNETLNDNVYNTALSFEMFHNFTLIHDDIMDNSAVRRGKPSVFNKFGATAAILSGDVMNICAYDRLAKVDDNDHLVYLLRLFNKTAIQICEGQQLDMDFESKTIVSLEEYIEMIELKTSVLLAACLQAGAILANANNDCQEKLYNYGIDLGIAFQIQDDYLDTFGTQEVIGKIPGGDIRSNKKTALTILLRNKMGDEAYEAAIEPLGKLADDAKYEAIKDLYLQQGIDKDVQALVSHYTNKAFDSLDSIAVANAKKENLIQLTHYLLNRNK